MVGFMNTFPDTFRTVSDSGLLGPKNFGKGMRTLAGWLTNSGCIAQAYSTPTHLPSMCQTIVKAMSQQLQSDLCVVAVTEPQHRPLLPKLDILAVDADEEPQVEWEEVDDVKGGPLDPHEVKTARQKETQYLWHREVYEYTGSSGSIPTKVAWKSRYCSRLVCAEVRHEGVEPIFSATPLLEAPRVLLCVACQEDVFCVEDPFSISSADVSRAHFYADAVRDFYVRLPHEDPKAKEPGECGKLFF